MLGEGVVLETRVSHYDQNERRGSCQFRSWILMQTHEPIGQPVLVGWHTTAAVSE